MLQEASLVGFFKIILYIALFYYLFKILSRIFAPILIKTLIKKAESKFGQNQQKDQTPHKKEGEISIDKIPQQKTSNKDVGEYVDYEEID
jgi:hypothetical protein